MATKKAAPGKAAPKKTTPRTATPKKAAPKKKDALVKIAETIGEVAGRISVKKDQLAGKASDAVDAIKEGMHNLVEKEKEVMNKIRGKAPKKAAPKKAAKPNPVLLHKTLHKKAGVKKAVKKGK